MVLHGEEVLEEISDVGEVGLGGDAVGVVFTDPGEVEGDVFSTVGGFHYPFLLPVRPVSPWPYLQWTVLMMAGHLT